MLNGFPAININAMIKFNSKEWEGGWICEVVEVDLAVFFLNSENSSSVN